MTIETLVKSTDWIIWAQDYSSADQNVTYNKYLGHVPTDTQETKNHIKKTQSYLAKSCG